ncbi:cyclic AMP-responsive element-binding protein 1 isoform X2 [Anabrus simplex]|uniref:cyclic AMP-responsive element-binding protein 1 isoform X2 n=1 Tax=Anabrus simplex TaxID=316456 RepID=UPI0034DCDE16
MDGMVEENGTSGNPPGDPLAHSPGDTNSSVVVTSVQTSSSQPHHLVAATSIVQLTIPTHVNNNNSTTAQVQSVIQPNQQSVIQTPGNIQPMQLQKGNVILVSKPNSVIQTTPGSLQTLQVVETGSDDSLSNDDESTKKRRDILTRRPSYRKILNDLGGGEIAVSTVAGIISDPKLQNHFKALQLTEDVDGHWTVKRETVKEAVAAICPGTEKREHQKRITAGRVESSSECDTNEDSELSSHAIPSQYQTHAVIPGTIQIASQGETVQGLHTLTMTNASTGGAIVHYASQGQDGQFFVPVVTQGGGAIGSGPIIAEDQARKREMRLLKNREAARECRRKKKEYIKCLENRVAVLENQNKALIDELKSLKELYCQQKTE